MIWGILGSGKHYKGPRKDIIGRKCPPKLKTGARNVKSVNVEETQSALKEPCSSLSLLVDRGSWSQWTLLCMQSSRGYRYCLVMVDHFTKWLESFPLRNQKAESIAKKVIDGWIPRHGAPEQLHHDQGKNLTAEIIRKVCSFLEIWNTRTTPFHPQSDGASERSIRTVNNMLAKVVEEDQRNWDLYVSSTCFAYNTAVHSSTGYTPSYLEYGRELRLPSDLVMNDHQQTTAGDTRTEYTTELKKRLFKAFECSREILESSHKTQKHYYDRWARGNGYKEGDLVMWKDQKTRNGRCMKLNKLWTGPWKVIKRLGEVVYRIKYVGHGKVGLKRRIVHHNQLKRYYETTDSYKEAERSETALIQSEDNNDRPENEADVVVIDGPELGKDQSCLTMENKRQERLRRTL